MIDDALKTYMTSELGNWSEGVALVQKLFDVAQPGAVFGHPVTAEGHTVITASEVFVGMGIGYGSGGGFSAADSEGEEAEEAAEAPEQDGGFGGGGGGGGAASGRPVAVISIGPQGVSVEPVMDVTKVAIAFFTMLGSLLVMIGKMRRAGGD